MTFSIVARSADGRSVGVAVASKYLAASAAVGAAEAGVGAVATQAWCNLAWRSLSPARLRAGLTAAEVVAELTAADPGAAERQLGVVGATGPAATFTGGNCLDWAGGVSGGVTRTGERGQAYAIQGNILVGPQVVEAMERAWLAGDPTAPLAPRLVATLAAGDAAGGDRRGRQSAGVLVASVDAREVNRAEFGSDLVPDVEVDLRVDDHPWPVRELARLLELHRLYTERTDPSTWLPLTAELAVEVDAHLHLLGHAPLPQGLTTWGGMENFEYRLHEGWIEPEILDQLRAAAARARG